MPAREKPDNHRQQPRRLLRVMGGLAAVSMVLALSGCGNDDTDGESDVQNPPTTIKSTVTTSPEEEGGATSTTMAETASSTAYVPTSIQGGDAGSTGRDTGTGDEVGPEPEG